MLMKRDFKSGDLARVKGGTEHGSFKTTYHFYRGIPAAHVNNMIRPDDAHGKLVIFLEAFDVDRHDEDAYTSTIAKVLSPVHGVVYIQLELLEELK